MTRQIKFRAWDKEKGKMRFPGNSEGMDGLFIYFSGEIGSIDFNCPDGGIGGFDGILMQYTGLTDKNGKEIYEGDIVRGIYYGEPDQQPVLWWKCGWYAGYNNAQRMRLTSLDAVSAAEVIGNIYEHPDFLSANDKEA